MTYGLPRPTAIKGNVTIDAAKRGITKLDAPCATCVESSNFPTRTCRACEKGKTPIPLITLSGFDSGINGTYSLNRSGTVRYTPLLQIGMVGVDFSGGATCQIAMGELDPRGTIDAQWPLRVIGRDGEMPVEASDSTILNGLAGLTCRKVDYVWNSENHTCYECGTLEYHQPTAAAARLSMEVIYHTSAIVVEMGYRQLAARVAGGGTWERGFDRQWRQVEPARRFDIPAGVTVVIHKEIARHETFSGNTVSGGYFRSAIGETPRATAVYHANISSSLTATDNRGNPLLECFGINSPLELVAKTIKSDALLRRHASVNKGGIPNCTGAPTQTPPYVQQTGTVFNQVNDFGTAGTIEISTSEAVMDIFLGSDLAAVAETDASCTVTDG